VQEAFTASNLDGALWSADLSADPGATVRIENGKALVGGQGVLLSKGEYAPSAESPMRVSGQATLTTNYNWFRMFLRGGPEGDGIRCVLSGYGQLYLVEMHGGQQAILAEAQWQVGTGREYAFTVEDDGNAVRFTVTEAGTGRTATLAGNSEARGAQQRVGFQGKYGVLLDNLRIERSVLVPDPAVAAAHDAAFAESVTNPIADAVTADEEAEPPANEDTEAAISMIVRAQDSFSESTLNPALWKTDTTAEQSSVGAQGGRARLNRLGKLISRDTFEPSPGHPLQLSGIVTLADPYNYQQIFLRTDDPSTGIACSISGYGYLYIVEYSQGQSTVLAEQQWSVAVGQQYRFSIQDDGERIDLTITEVSTERTAALTGRSMVTGENPRIMFRGKYTTELDDICIEQGIPAQESQALAAAAQREAFLQPEFSIVECQGPNAVLRFSSPYDASRIEIDGGGVLSASSFAHEGGTAGTLTSVTIRAENKAGEYCIRLVEPMTGRVLQSLPVRWDCTSLTPARSEDMWAAEDYVAELGARQLVPAATGDLAEDVRREVQLEALYVLAEQKMAAERSTLQAVTSFHIENSAVRANLASDLWSQSGLSLTLERAEQLFFSRNPQYMPEHLPQTIDQEWQASPGFSRGQIQDRIISRLQDLLARVARGANAYNSDLQNIIFPAALQVMEGVRRGETEAPLRAAFEATLRCLSNVRTAELCSLTGFKVPSEGTILAAARTALFSACQTVAYYQGEDSRVQMEAQREYERDLEAQWVFALEASERLARGGAEGERVTREVALGNRQLWVAHMEAMRAGQRIGDAAAQQNRSQQRAARLVATALASQTDRHVQVVLAAEGVANVQRDRQEAVDALYAALTPERALAIDSELLRIHAEHPDDPDAAAVLSERYVTVQARDLSLGAEIGGMVDNLGYGVQANIQTVAGRIFSLAVRQLRAAGTPEQRDLVAQWVEQKTGIPASKILGRVEYSGELFRDDLMTLGLKRLFEEAQLSSAFTQEWDAPMQAATDKFTGKDGLPGALTVYRSFSSENTPADAEVRVRFNVNLPSFHHARYYLLDGSGTQVGDELRTIDGVEETGSGTLTAVFPLADIAARLREYGAYGGGPAGPDGGPVLTMEFSVRVVVWQGAAPEPHVWAQTPEAEIQASPQSIEDLSVLPDTPEHAPRRAYENAVLTQVERNFPVDLAAGNWKHNLGSPYHLDRHLASMDFNLSTGADTDEDQPVRAVAGGEIVEINTELGSVLIRHTEIVQGTERAWYSKYLHMKIEATDRSDPEGRPVFEVRGKNGGVVTELFEGKQLAACDLIGGIGGRGTVNGERSDHAFATHLHLEILDDALGQIDARGVLQALGIPTKAADDSGRELDVVWVDGIAVNGQNGQWMNAEYNLIFSRGASGSGLDNVWVANAEDPAQRKRVVWMKVDEIEQDGKRVPVMRWVQFGAAGFDGTIWDPFTSSWTSYVR